MGICSSRQKNKNKEANMPPTTRENSELVNIDSVAQYDQQFVENLRKEFKNDFETFLLNHILMSFVFFENYERDIQKLSTSVSDWEKSYNKRMLSEHQKQCLMPDTVFELVSKHVRYRPFHGPKKTVSEPIAPQRLFIIHENIEVPDPFDNSLYTKIDKPAYRAYLEESSHHKGYVKLRQMDLSSKRYPPSEATSRSDSDDSLYEELPSTSKDEPSTSGTSTGVSSESEYDYSRITEFRTPVPLHISESDIYTTIGTLPSKCFTSVKVKNREGFDADDEDDAITSIEAYIKKKKAIEKNLYINVNYFNSHEFMTHFADRVFPNVLGKALDFTDNEILEASFAECKIFSNTRDDDNNLIQCEIIPCIAIPWPSLAFHWSSRKPTVATDLRTMISYQWPTEMMKKEIKTFNCVVVPKGFMPKRNRQKNPNIELEWEVAFPKAERYLETRMTHAQMRCYLLLLVLHKAFIEPLTRNHGLLPEHIRIIMFWECEKDYMRWNDCKLWNKLKFLLQHIDESLSSCNLQDYFVKNKNVLENVQKRYLLATKQVIFKILESPVPHFIKALRNLRCMSGKFYPTPNLKKLHDIILQDPHSRASMANGHVASKERAYLPPVARQIAPNDRDQAFRLMLLEHQRNERLKKKTKELQRQKQKENENLSSERRESVDSINMEMFERGHTGVDDIKRRSILMFFIDHFIAVAKTGNRIGSTRQTLFYLKQAWYLTRLLADTPANQEDVTMYDNIINREEELCQRKAENHSPRPRIASYPVSDRPRPQRMSSVYSDQSNSPPSIRRRTVKIVSPEPERRKTVAFKSEESHEVTSF